MGVASFSGFERHFESVEMCISCCHEVVQLSFACTRSSRGQEGEFAGKGEGGRGGRTSIFVVQVTLPDYDYGGLTEPSLTRSMV